MRLPFLFLLLGAARLALAAPFAGIPHHSVSRSHQFIVYADDPNARAQLAMYAEDTKDKLLQILQAPDGWKIPIVIQLTMANAADPSRPVSDVRVYDTADGFKVELDVVLGEDPRLARFPQQLTRALLLEYAYRDQTNLIKAGSVYTEPPPWLVEGLANMVADPDPEAGTSLFRSLIASSKNPTLEKFLAEQPDHLDTPSHQMYSACAMSIVKLLAELPDGHRELRDFIRHWPGPEADPQAELLSAFPGLISRSQGLEKWWALGLARLSAADRYQGFTLAETNQKLTDSLTLTLAGKTGQDQPFSLEQYSNFKKLPGAKAALNGLSDRLLGLEAQANPLFRPVVEAYQDIAVNLAHGRSKNLTQRLTAANDYRGKLNARMDHIADYLNWYEATQRTDPSGSFDEYIRTADALDKNAGASERADPISKYLDGIEQQITDQN